MSKTYKNQTTYNRVPHNQDNTFTVISNKLIKDKSLNFIDKGLMIYLLSNSDSYVVNTTYIQKNESGIGQDAFYNSIKKLIGLGYIVKEQIQSGFLWTINESRYSDDYNNDELQSTDTLGTSENTISENTTRENTISGNTTSENTTLISTNEKNTNEIITNEKNINEIGPSPEIIISKDKNFLDLNLFDGDIENVILMKKDIGNNSPSIDNNNCKEEFEDLDLINIPSISIEDYELTDEQYQKIDRMVTFQW